LLPAITQRYWESSQKLKLAYLQQIFKLHALPLLMFRLHNYHYFYLPLSFISFAG
jgi:hypothetical protein